MPLVFVRVDRGRDAVGHQRLQPSEQPPPIENGRVVEEVRDIGFVVAFEADELAGAAARHQHIQDLAGLRAAVDVIADKHFDRALGRIACTIRIDAREQLGQEIGAAVDVTDGIDAQIGRRPRREFLGARQQGLPHELRSPERKIGRRSILVNTQ